MRRKALKAAFPHTLPILTGFAFLGLAYGIYMNTSGFHPVHWEISPFCSFRHARHLLPEKCQLSERKPRSPGAARDRHHRRPPPLETPDAFFNLRRDDLLYATASVCILRYHLKQITVIFGDLILDCCPLLSQRIYICLDINLLRNKFFPSTFTI